MSMFVKRYRAYYLLLILFIVIYIAELFLIPPDSAALTRYSLSGGAARAISLSFALPLCIIWYAAFYGFTKFKQYANLAGKTKDGHALRILGNGLLALAFSLPISAILGNPRTYLGRLHPDLVPTITIAYNYINLAMSLLALWLIALGSKKLVHSLKDKQRSIYQIIIGFIFILFCVVYTYTALTDPRRQNAAGPIGNAAYYLPDFLVFSTIIVPYIVLWSLGLRAAYNIQLYSKRTAGVLYKDALGRVSLGIVFVVISLMMLRVFASMSSFLNGLSLRYLLVVIYVLLIVIGVGYVLVASGAKKLKKIEEV